MRFKRHTILPFVVSLSLLFFGCEEGPLKFSVRYGTLGELRSRAPVYFEKTQIGRIDKIVSTDNGDYLVEVSIDPEHKGAATENSKFFIQDDPFQPERKAIIVEQEPLGGTVLENGNIVQGEKRQGFLGEFLRTLKKSSEDASVKLQESMQIFKESVAKNTQSFNEQLDESLNDIDRYMREFENSKENSPKEDELEKLNKSIEDFIAAFKNANEDLQNKIKEEILPQLKEDLEELRNWLKREGRNCEAEKVDHQINDILKV